jgi:hypothetical protein
MKGGEGACLFEFNGGGGGEREAVMCALLSSPLLDGCLPLSFTTTWIIILNSVY